jgi:methionine-rich copper-binding protein CopC
VALDAGSRVCYGMHRYHPITRLGALLLALGVATAALAAPTDAAPTGTAPTDAARRHTRLVRSIPERDSVIATAPARVQLWFNEAIELKVSRLRLDGPAARGVALQPLERAEAADAPVTAPLPAGLVDGRYVVHWSTASKDGHVVRDSFAFHLRHR